MEDAILKVRFPGGGPAISLARGQCWAISGGSARTLSRLCRRLAGEEPPPRGMSVSLADGVEDSVRLVSFAQQSAAAQRGGFMQARYHSLVDDAGPGDSVADVLGFNRVFGINPYEVGRSRGTERRAYAEARRRIEPLLRVGELKDRLFLALSNGETRRVLLARALLAAPALLVLDDPCAGLDAVCREQVRVLMDALAAQGMALVVAVRHADEIPSCATTVTRLAIRGGGKSASRVRAVAKGRQRRSLAAAEGEPVVELRDIRVAYGRRKLLDGLSWIVRRGERWVLSGPNGSGKTTLLSLITGDNPLAYANDVTVFGARREPGTELAKVRRRIGMVSPELQAYLGQDAESLLSAALGKRPELLLLDEPCLNLDEAAARRLRGRVERYLAAHPACAAICVAHRPEDVPAGFNRFLSLDGRKGSVL